MLNQNGERELAYVVKIDAIEPIVGSDNCEAAIVGGWRVMVRKGTFNPGDLAVYFEIDSKVDTTRPEFAFLASKGGKIKTQRYTFGGKGLMISQGLLMAPDDFGWSTAYSPANPDELYIVGDPETNFNLCYRLGSFLTKDLGVTYSDANDNVRKANPEDKYKKMSQRHQKIFKQPFARWMMRRKWGREVMFFFFGKKKDKKSGWPSWVVKTDEERCLSGKTKIQTDHGALRISDIVNKQLNVKVLSYNQDDNMLEYKDIVSYQKYSPNPHEDKYSIEFPYRAGVARVKHLECTADHKIYTQRGYVKASELTLNDTLFMAEASSYWGQDILSVIYGMLLGDGSIHQDKRCHTRVCFQTCHGTDQFDYIHYINDMFEDGTIIDNGSGSFTAQGKTMYKLYLEADPYLDANIKKDWLNNPEKKKKISSSVIDKLTEASLAFWYMDDGSISYRDGLKVTNHSPSVRLNTQGFSIDEVNMLVDMLINKFNIKCNIRNDRGPIIYICTDSTPDFLNIVTPYMCKSMAYKTLPSLESLLETKKFSFKKQPALIKVPILGIKSYKDNKATYDIEVKDNHNFIAQGILTHNCQNMPWILNDKSPWIATEKIDGTSTTFTMKRGKKRLFGKNENEFYICSRNVVFDKPDKKCFYPTNVYIEMAQKYKMEAVLETYLNTHPDVEWVTIQGETFGDGIQKRNYSLKGHEFMAFNLIDSVRGRWNSVEAKDVCDSFGIPWVPILNDNFILPDTVDELLNIATGESVLDHGMREGIVFRYQDGTKSFKAVSNEFLLKYHNG